MRRTRSIRPPAVAGTFYPSTPAALEEQVRQFLGSAAQTSRHVRAVIAPHAGYVYSGALCGQALGSVGWNPKRIWLLGPSHHVALRGWSHGTADVLATPLGETAVDHVTLRMLEEAEIDDRADGPEHSLETHLPFLQTRWPEVPVIPLLSPFHDDPGAVDWLTRHWRDGDLISVSSDLSHFHPEEEAERLDAATQTAVEHLEAKPIGPEQACGWVAVRTLLRFAKRKGWTARTLARTNSAVVSGDSRSVVGYGAWVLEDAE